MNQALNANAPKASSQARAPGNFVDLVRDFAARRPQDHWLTVAQWGQAGPTEYSITYAAFDERVRELAARLQRDFAPGERALVMFDNDEHYAVGMLACFYAGVIAVPVFPPASNRPQHMDRLVGIARDAQARCVLTTQAWRPLVEEGDRFAGATVIAADDPAESLAAQDWRPHSPAGQDIAFLQYTSGSTSAPKGVMVSHANLMANEHAMQRGMSIGPDDRYVCWTPLYHDMGLIGGLFMPLFAGIPVVLMSPWAFAESPQRWLDLISRHRATVSGGPDFAYRLCLDRVSDAQLARLDLSSWRVAYTGAEPVRADTEAAFIERFAAAGFPATTAYPCYGLAEATLYTSGGQRGQGFISECFSAEALAIGQAVPAAVGTTLVACGVIAEAHQLDIVDPASGESLPAGQVGEIRVSGPSIAQGYWNHPEATAKAFIQVGGQRWLRTGDLGFLHGGQLYIAGRIKDIIIVRGHNLYPQDIERHIEQEVGAARAGRVAVFAVPGADGGEGIGVAMEVSRNMQKLVPPAKLLEVAHDAVADAFGEPVSALVLLQPGHMPKTSSGKLQRQACRQGWQDRSLEAYAIYEAGAWAVGGPAQDSSARTAEHPALQPGQPGQLAEIAAIWAAALQRKLPPNTWALAHFFRLGGHSLQATQVAAQTAERFGIALPVRALFHHPGLWDFARHVADCIAQARAPSGPQRGAADGVRSGAVALSAQQRRLWLVDRLATTPRAQAAYNIAFAVHLAGRLDADRLERALHALVLRHEVLRTRFTETEDGEPCAWLDEASTLVLERRQEDPAPLLEEIGRRPFDLATDQPVRAALCGQTDHHAVLVLSFHHIAVDGWSIAVLAKELGSCYQAAGGEGDALPAPLIQYRDYAAWQASSGPAQATAFWKEHLAGLPAESVLPADRPRPSQPAQDGEAVVLRIDAAQLQGLQRLAAHYEATLFQLLMSLFLLQVHQESGRQDVAVGTDLAGRDHASLLDAVGFFVNVLPVRSRLGDGPCDLGQWLAGFQRSFLAGLVGGDTPFECIVDAVQPERHRGRNPLVQMLFVLHNTPPVAFTLPGLHSRVEMLPVRDAKFDLAVFAREEGGALEVEWVFSTELYDRATVERFAAEWSALLGRAVAAPESDVRELMLAYGRPQPAGRSSKRDQLQALLTRANRDLSSPGVAALPGVRASFLEEGRTLPLVLEPQEPIVDVAAWAARHAAGIEALVSRHGGILFRGFGIATPQAFESFAEAVEPELFGDYGDLPKKEGGRKTYRSTPYPEREMILFHNESAHTGRWPRKQWFFCELPAPHGGATPIVDCREMLRYLPQDVVDAFERKGLLYQRTFHPGLDVRWQDFYKTDSRAEVEARLAADGIEGCWLDADLLQTFTRAPGIIVHPVTRERVFFNQVQLHHAACLAPDLRESLVELVGEDRLPRHVRYGDGSPIDEDTMRLIGEAYETCAVRFGWRQGDIVMLDNMLAAHARDPFEGPRKVVVAMGAMWDLRALRQANGEVVA